MLEFVISFLPLAVDFCERQKLVVPVVARSGRIRPVGSRFQAGLAVFPAILI